MTEAPETSTLRLAETVELYRRAGVITETQALAQLNALWADLRTRPLYPGEPTPTMANPGADGGGLRHDAGKPRWDLLPPEALEALAEHYTKGLAEYPERNWERGMAWCKCFASAMRHSWRWMRGEDFDAKTESHHMIAVAWNALALYTYHARKVGTDDRPKL